MAESAFTDFTKRSIPSPCEIQSLFPAICFVMAAPALAIDPPEYPLEQADVFDDPGTDPKPEGNPGEWVTPMDYPSAALREELEGAVGFRLIVDQNGKPSNCLITSSGALRFLWAASEFLSWYR
jgi:hypothetical protein